MTVLTNFSFANRLGGLCDEVLAASSLTHLALSAPLLLLATQASSALVCSRFSLRRDGEKNRQIFQEPAY